MTMMNERKLVLATNNKGKMREFDAMFAPLGIEVVNQGALGVGGCEEPFGTFLENALEKARHASRETGLPAMADDSGICVNALMGAPGVHSARYSGVQGDDAANNALLVKNLRGEENRRAHFICVLVAVRTPEDPEPLVAVGRWFGEIVDQAGGTGGFGYDPHFFVPELGRTAAELEPAEKNRLSHRGQALRAMVPLLKNVWGWS